MKTRHIVAGDLKVGMYVIVRQWHQAQGAAVGIPLKVVGLALPLMTVQYCPQPTVRGVMDTRQMSLTQVDLAYVRSLVPSYNARKPTATPKQPGVNAAHVHVAMGPDTIQEE